MAPHAAYGRALKLRVTGSAIDDPRVVHLWDENRVVGEALATAPVGGGSPGDILWDAYFLYGPTATWGDMPDLPLSMGATVLGQREALESSLKPLLIE